MDTKNALLLLAKLGNSEKVLEIAKSYVADMLSAYHNVEEYALMKDGTVTPFANIDEFADLRKNVAKIEAATTVIDEFFMIEEDIEKLRNYAAMGMLVFYEEPVEEVTEVKVEETKPELKAEAKPAKEMPKFETPKAEPKKEAKAEEPKKTSSVPEFSSAYKVTTAKPESKPVQEQPEEEEKSDFVGITKIDTEDSVKAMVGYAEGDNYENPYECVYEDDIIPDDAIPTAIKLFDGPPKTEPDDILAEAKMVIEEGKNYIFTGCNPSAYLNKRFEYYRIKYALKNIEDGGEPEPEVEIIKGELDKIREFEKRNTLLSIQLVEYDMALVEKVYGLLKEFDEKLYPPEALPNIDRLRELMDSLSDYDEKASLLTKFYKFDVMNFLKTVYNSCKGLELDKNKRLAAEKDRLEKESFDEIMALEKEYYASKQGLKGKLLGSGAKNSYTTKKKELEDKMNKQLDELQKEITEIVEKDTKMVGKNMKLYARIDNLLKNNVLCFKTK